MSCQQIKQQRAHKVMTLLKAMAGIAYVGASTRLCHGGLQDGLGTWAYWLHDASTYNLFY